MSADRDWPASGAGTDGARRLPRVIFINRFFHPDHSATSQMLSDLAFDLAARGLDIRVITSRQRYEEPGAGLAARESVGGVRVERVWSTAFGRRGLIGRAADYATFYLAAAAKLSSCVRRGDIVVAKTDPPLLSLFVWPVARLKGARLVNWLQDLYPEVATALGIGGPLAQPVLSLLKALRTTTLKRAAANVVLGRLMAERLAALGVARDKVHIIANWADGECIRPVPAAMNRLRKAWGLSECFVVAYSGNLGRAHEHATMLAAAERIRTLAKSGNPGAEIAGRIRFLFIGGGAAFERLAEAAAARALDNVLFRPYQPREALSESLSAGDVHLVSLLPALEGLIVPSKLYGIAAAGRPVLFLGSPTGEVARILAERRFGWAIEPGQGQVLADRALALAADPLLAEAMGGRARAAFEDDFDKRLAVEQWAKLLEACASPEHTWRPRRDSNTRPTV